MMVEVNFVSVIAAAVVSMIIGFLWYSPWLLGNPWMKLMGHTKQSLSKKNMQFTYLLSFVGALVTAFVLYHLIAQAKAFYQMDAVTTGFLTGMWGWLGLVMPVQMTEVLFGGKKWMLFGINTGYQLVSLLAMGVVIGILG